MILRLWRAVGMRSRPEDFATEGKRKANVDKNMLQSGITRKRSGSSRRFERVNGWREITL